MREVLLSVVKFVGGVLGAFFGPVIGIGFLLYKIIKITEDCLDSDIQNRRDVNFIYVDRRWLN